MGTGLIFAAIVAAWLAYLVPLYLRRQQSEAAESDSHDGFSSSARIVASGAAPLVDVDGTELSDVEVSTPMTRRSAVRRLTMVQRRAAVRRRRVLLVLLMAVTAGLVAAVLGYQPWWAMAIPGGLLVLFLAVARLTVASMHRRHDRLVAEILHGAEQEDTVRIQVGPRSSLQPAEPTAAPERPQTRPVAGLWDPIPVTTPTYVSKPLAPRTVRTIDLSAPDVTSSGRGQAPVLAETAPVLTETSPDPAEQDQQHRRAAGE